MTDLTPIFEALIALALALITTFLVPYIKEKIDADKLAKIQYWVKVGVEAAEQILNYESAGEEKKQYVLNFLESKGFSIDPVEINNLIESAVYQLNDMSTIKGDGNG